jgi:hypothetical protein
MSADASISIPMRKLLMADQRTGWDLLMSIRGGFPRKCDFCDQPYGDDRYPVPEEAGAWACSECEARWRKADAGR